MAITVVNMIPVVFSGETNQDSEPNIAVDPADPRRIAASAFTPDPLGGANAPIFVSNDGGDTWQLRLIVPSQAGQATGDISLAFGHGGRLYAGILRRPGSLRLNILRTTNINSPALMTVLVDRPQVDQPFVEVDRVRRGPGVGSDRVFVGNNDFAAAPAGRTATVDVSLDGAAAAPPPPANFAARRIEARATSGQDLPPIRPAVHIDGTVYAAFIARRAGGTSDIVVVRDDDWASGANPFTALTDPADLAAGRLVVTGVNVPFENFNSMGGERLVASDLSIAVDPGNSSLVYVAWADRPPGTANLTIHVRRSADRGSTWSAADLRTVSNAKAPALAINSRGRVAFAYQELTGPPAQQRWVTQVEQSDDAFATFATSVLSSFAVNNPMPAFLPYLGDYMDLKGVGKDFYGIFSSGNVPDDANFPSGVTYQRNANFATNTLLANNGITPVNPSIDPFFYRIETIPAAADFYVADWTDSATSFDLGVEPSTEPFFYVNSDVWTRRTDAPGPFDADNRPVNEPPQNGMGAGGDNFAFARIRRRGTGSPGSVTAHFLVSEFGVGSNYADAGAAPDIAVSFAAADQVKTMAVGYPWHLDETSSTHLCLAVEVDSADDPIVAPSLLGRAPGWPTTDLLVVNDNNKAQRNMGVGPTIVGGWMTRFALVHNAATITRDVTLRYSTQGRLAPARRDRIEVTGARPRSLKRAGELVLSGMRPGENRWVGLTLSSAEERDGTVIFEEVVDGSVVNGFGLRVVPVPADEGAAHLLDRCRSVFTRLAAVLDQGRGRELAEEASALLERQGGAAGHRALAGDAQGWTSEVASVLIRAVGGDPHGLRAAVRAMATAVGNADDVQLQSLHHSLLERLDATVSALLLAGGSEADIAQSARWQGELLADEALGGVRGVRAAVQACARYDTAVAARQATAADYPPLIERLAPVLGAVAAGLGDAELDAAVAALDPGVTARQLQRDHRRVLLRLEELIRPN